MRGAPAPRPQQAARWCWYALLAALAAWGAGLALNPRRAADLRIYVDAAERFWRGAALYPPDRPIGFKYTPAVAWLFTPFVPLPPAAAAAVWNVGAVAAFAFAATRWRNLLDEDERYRDSAWAAIAAVVVLVQSFFLELFYGQVDLVILALLVCPFAASGRRRDVWPGLCIAVAALLKPPSAVIAAALLATGRRRTVASALAWVGVLHVPLALRFGFRGGAEQLWAWATTVESTEASWAVGHNPQGLPTLLLSALFPLDARPSRGAELTAVVATAAVIVALPLLARLRGAGLVSVLCAGAAFASPLAWRANFVLAWPLVVTLASARAPRRARSAGAIAIGLVAAVEWIVSEAVLGPARGTTVLAARPWAIAFTVLIATALWVLPKAEPPRSEASATAPPP